MKKREVDRTCAPRWCIQTSAYILEKTRLWMCFHCPIGIDNVLLDCHSAMWSVVQQRSGALPTAQSCKGRPRSHHLFTTSMSSKGAGRWEFLAKEPRSWGCIFLLRTQLFTKISIPDHYCWITLSSWIAIECSEQGRANTRKMLTLLVSECHLDYDKRY